ncbi:MAG: Ldh family oxidoreductase [Gemmatimonadetes bacterium]|nr:Ldh family oxidoreductase [Gemmatimonadota bacterium]
MLERFHVSEEVAVRVREPALRSTVERIFMGLGVPGDHARVGADVLVAADLRGVETHGVSNILRGYVRGYSDGSINPRPALRIVRETASCATVDCDRGLGIIMAPKAMGIAIEKARATGVGMVSMGNGGHLGMAAYHAMLAVEHEMIGVCMTSCPATVAPTFAARAAVGTNPIAVAAPAGEEVPFVFDAATSATPVNRVRLAARLGVNLAPGWIATPDGTPIMEEVPVPERWSLLPLGSTRELGSHKGYSLAAVVDILGSVLNGNAAAPTGRFRTYGHFVAAYSVEAFVDVGEFKQGMDEYLRALRSLEPAPGHERVLYAGMLEAEVEAERRARGIPLHPEVIDWFRNTCAEMEIDFIL